MYDRLAIVLNDDNGVTLVGYRPAHDKEKADLENGFPTTGRWFMDYVDNIGTQKNAVEWARMTADSMWGTVFTTDGEFVRDDLLDWHESEECHWASRNRDAYNQACLQAWQDLDDKFANG